MLFREIALGIEKHGVLSLDLETTSKDPTEAEITLIAMASGVGRGIQKVAVRPTKEAVDFMVKNLLDERIRVVGHNILSYDLQVLHYRGILPLGNAKAKIVDTLPMAWLLNENTDHDLKFMVGKLFGHKMASFGEAFLFSPALKKIAELQKQIKEIEKTKIERVGVEFRKKMRKVKKETKDRIKEEFQGKRTRADQSKKKEMLANLEWYLEETFGEEAQEDERKRIRKVEIQPILDEVEILNLSAEKDKINYAEDDAKQTLRLYHRLRRLMKERGLLRWAQLEIDVRRVASEMELNGISVDLSRLADLREVLERLMEEYQAKAFNVARMDFNLRSWPQVQKVVYDVLRVVPPDGERNTDEKTLSRINHPIGQAILDYRAAQKLHSTYVMKIEDKVKKDPKCRLHGGFNTNGTVTGRWSSSGPNLQNIPSRRKADYYDEKIQGVGPTIRRVFISTKKYKLICADLSQIELRLIAHFSGDHNLLRVYSQKAEWDGMTFWTGDVHDETRRFVSEMVGYDIGRKLAKNLNFGLCFGMFPKKFAVYAKLFFEGTYDYDVEKAAAFRDGFFRAYPGILNSIDTLHELRNNKHMVRFRTISGRSRYFPKGEWINGGTVFNAIVQGSAADILKAVVLGINRNIVKNPKYDAKLILQVHDEVSLEAPEDQAEEVAVLVKYIMEADWFKIAVPILAGAKICDDWALFNDDDIPEVGVTPPKETGIKPAVAMLSPEQRNWAAQHVKVDNFNLPEDLLQLEEFANAQ
jgi:DNA polymerase I-like protein with 3'-5' exonuclease and polymerase domains